MKRLIFVVVLLTIVVVGLQHFPAITLLPKVEQCAFGGSTRECIIQNGKTYILDQNIDSSWEKNLREASKTSGISILVLPALDVNSKFVDPTNVEIDLMNKKSLWVETGKGEVWEHFKLPGPAFDSCDDETVECKSL